MSRRLLLCRYLMMIRTSQHWIPKQTHLWWVSRAAPLSRLTRKQPHPVKNPLDLSVLSCVHSVKFTKKACRPCFLPKRLQQDHFCSLLTRTSLIKGNWFVYCRPCFCWCSLYGRRDGEVQNVSYKRFPPVGQWKIRPLVSVLQRRVDSPFFSEQWNHIVVRINKKCRGKRRTLIHRLKKTSLFRKHKDGTISLWFPTKDYGLVNWTELVIVQQNRVLSYFKFD